MKNNALLIYLFSCCICLLLSCGNESAEEMLPEYSSFDGIQKKWRVDTTQVVTLPIPAQAEQELLFSHYIDTSWSIPLETNSESIIGAVDKVLIFNDIIYVLDIRKAKHLLAFDLKGNFLFKVGQQGLKRGSYLQPDDFCVNREEQKIVIYDDFQRKLLYYALDGTFLEENKMGFYLFGIDHLNGEEYVLNSFGRSNPNTQDAPYRLLLQSSDGIQQKGLPYQKTEEKLSYRTCLFEFTRFNDELLYSPNFLGETYAVNSSGLSLKYRLDFGEKSLPMSYRNMEVREFIKTFNALEGQTYAYYFGPLFETNHHLVFNLMQEGNFYIGFYSKHSGETRYGPIIDDLPHSLRAFRFFTTYQDQYLVGSGDSYYFSENKAKYSQAKCLCHFLFSLMFLLWKP